MTKATLRTLHKVIYRCVSPLFPYLRTARALQQYPKFVQDWQEYQQLPQAEQLHLLDAYPQIGDATASTPYDPHYFYQEVWAFKAIAAAQASLHLDVGSRISFVKLISALCDTVFVDIRPLIADVDRLFSQSASILQMPYADNSIHSLSCLHVTEHIGLGRYGDPLSPTGSRDAAQELARVLAPGGNLYFSTPIGRPRVEFNAHRIHSISQVVRHFAQLELVRLSVVDDAGQLNHDVTNLYQYDNARYCCGLFHFRKLS